MDKRNPHGDGENAGGAAPEAAAKDGALPDSVSRSLVDFAPAAARPYLRLARWDRPVGAWLLALPGFCGVALAGFATPYAWSDPVLILLLAIGAVAMRGAGCTYNDIVDRRLDARVARTANRPVASGEVSLPSAWFFVLMQCLVGLGVLAVLPRFAQIVALCSIPLVALYPFMKRITWWPQAWLGLAFNWAALVGYAAASDRIDGPAVLLYVALIFWTLGYDTIYALQDREDDALAGVKSSARALGSRVREGVSLFFGVSASVAAVAAAAAAGSPWAGLAALGYAAHLYWQSARLRPADGGLSLRLFRSNRTAGLLLFAGIAIAVTVLDRLGGAL